MMNHKYLLHSLWLFLAVFCISALLTTCKKDDETPAGPGGGGALTTINFTDPSPSINLSATGGTESRKLAGGTLPLTITSTPNAAVATATLRTDTLTVTPIGPGSTSLTITDSSPVPSGTASRTLNISLLVSGGSVLIAFPASITVTAGGVASSKISNGTTPYSIQTAPTSTIATALMQGDSLKVTGVATGSAFVVVRDASATPKTVTVPITVTGGGGGLTATPPQVMVQVGQQLATQISGGTMPYSFQTPPNSSIATAQITNNIIVVEGIAVGNTSMVVQDASNPPRTVTVPITITSGTGNINITVGSGTTPTFSWTGGTGSGVQTLNVINTVSGTFVWQIACTTGVDCIASPVTCGTVPAGALQIVRVGIPLTPGIEYQVIVSRTNQDLGSALFRP